MLTFYHKVSQGHDTHTVAEDRCATNGRMQQVPSFIWEDSCQILCLMFFCACCRSWHWPEKTTPAPENEASVPKHNAWPSTGILASCIELCSVIM